MPYIIIALLVIAIVVILIKNKNRQNETIVSSQAENSIVTESPVADENISEEIKDEKIPYIRKNLMTKNEWGFYKALKPIADELNLSILCKTRIADLIEIEKGLSKSEWQTAFNRINKKHIDFILCKPENLYPVLLIELDDNSHDTEKGKQRDEFVEKILQKTGYKLLRTRGTAELEERIKNSI